MRHLLSIADLGDDELRHLVDRSVAFARDRTLAATTRPLAGRVVGIYFRKTSTRTRTAFSAGALRLGASIISYGPDDLQENTGEVPADTGRVLSGMLDAFVARTAGPDTQLRAYARQSRMAVVNAMSAREHPTQAIADLTTIAERFGQVDGITVRYIGEGNNTAVALALALARFPGTKLHLNTPAGYGLPPDVAEQARITAKRVGATLVESHDMTPCDGADIVYTTRWQTTGTSKPDVDWQARFAPFHVDEQVLAGQPGAVFMHDLPAHRGEEVTSAVLDGPASIAFQQAHHKMHSAMAVLEWCLSDHRAPAAAAAA